MFFVRPDLRHQGCGKRILATALAVPGVADIDVWEAGGEPDNAASRRCLEAIGFTEQGRDSEWSDYLLRQEPWRAGDESGKESPVKVECIGVSFVGSPSPQFDFAT